MGYPKFTEDDGSNSYIFEEYPSLPSDRSDLLAPAHIAYAAVVHARMGIVFARKVIASKYKWDLIFRNITKSMVDSLMTFFDDAFFRLYPDSDAGDYFDVYLLDEEVKPELQRGGTYNLSFSLGEK